MSGSQNFVSRTDARDCNSNNSNTYRNHNHQFRGNDPRHHQQQQLQQQQWQRQQQWQQQQQLWQQQHKQHQQQQLQKQQQQQQQAVVVNNDDRNDSDDPNAAFSKPLLSSPKNKITNMERFLQSLIPVVRARRLPAEVNVNELVNGENGSCPFFYIGDLRESFTEWSAYGAGVPLVLSDEFRTTQFYCPSLSGMQIYVKPKEEETTVGSTKEEADPNPHGTESETKFVSHGSSTSASCELTNLRQQPSDFRSEGSRSRGTLDFQFFESIFPHLRKPLSDKASELAPEFPQLSTYRSCDLLPSSWVAVLWYPIYRVPMGPSRKSIEASILTLHSLSTQPGSITEAAFSKRNTGAVPDEIDLRLPIIGLATYKLYGSIIAPTDPRECLQEKVWFEAATNWLHDVEAHLPDHKFFLSRRFSR